MALGKSLRMHDIQNTRLHAALIHAMQMRGDDTLTLYISNMPRMRISTDQRCMEPLFFQTRIFAVSSMGCGYAKRFFSHSYDPNKLMLEHNVLH